MDKDVLSFTTNENGAGMSFLTNGEVGYIGYDVSYALREMQEMGFRPIAGIQSMDVGYSGESEVKYYLPNSRNTQTATNPTWIRNPSG